MRLIDADKLEARLLNMMDLHSEIETPMAIMLLQGAIDIIKKTDTVKAEPVRHGEWLYNDIYLPSCAECSECGWKSSVSGDEIPSYHYCPNCGAKMDVEQ